MSATTIYIIAGEVSGDRLGAGIMRELKSRLPEVRFAGIGGPMMQAEGLSSLFDYSELALMGFAEVLPKAFHFLGRIDATVEDIDLKNPAMVITIDSPGFCTRVVKKARKHRLKATFLHVVAPTVWAYKEKRAEKFAKLFDHLMVILPFEPPYFEKVGLATTFIGHPSVAVDKQRGDGAAFRKKYHLSDARKVIALLPGSRENEVKRHLSIMSGTIDLLAQDFPNLVLVSSAPPHIQAMLREYFMTSPYRNILLLRDDEKMDAFAAADVALVKSGTVSLEMAYARTPMVVMYKVNKITAWIVKRMIKLPYVSLVNVIQHQHVIPEFLQENATSEKLSEALKKILISEQESRKQIEAFDDTVNKLRRDDALPAQIAAQKIIEMLKKNSVSS